MALYEQLAKPGSLWFESTLPEAPRGDSLFFSDPLETLTLRAGDDVAGREHGTRIGLDNLAVALADTRTLM